MLRLPQEVDEINARCGPVRPYLNPILKHRRSAYIGQARALAGAPVRAEVREARATGAAGRASAWGRSATSAAQRAEAARPLRARLCAALGRVRLGRERVAVEVFSGSGRLAAALRSRGITAIEWDIVRGEMFDLTRPVAVETLKGWTPSGEVLILWLGTPCTSFSLARRLTKPGPGPLRSRDFPLGLPGLPAANQKKVDLGNRLMKVSASLARIAHSRDPGGIENLGFSRPWECAPIRNLLRLSGVHDVITDFCMWGEPWRKRTRLRLWHVNSSSLGRRCRGRSVRSFAVSAPGLGRNGARGALLDCCRGTISRALVPSLCFCFVRRCRVAPPRPSLGPL